MAGGKPWEKYQAQSAPPAAAPKAGPWTKYAKQAAPVAQDTGPVIEGGIARPPRVEAQGAATQQADWRNDGQTGIVEQSTAGFNAGVADLIGAPVDLMAGGINGVTGLVNAATGTSIPQISDPAGGSASMRRMMAPTITEDEPQTAGQRYARSVAHEVAMATPAVAALGGANTARQAVSAVAPAVASAVGGGVGAQAARDVFPGNPYAEMAGNIVGSLVPVGVSMAMSKGAAKAPTVEELRAQASDLYQQGRSRAGVPAGGVDPLRADVDTILRDNSRITPAGRVLAEGKVKTYLDVLDDYKGQPMTPGEMQSVRTILQDAAASADATERRLGKQLLTQFDDWAGQAVPEFKDANAIYSRAKRAEDIDFRVEKAERRAASTGTGGNTVNAARQNIRGILDNPKARRGYSADEIAAMEAIVRGDSVTNALRLAGRLSPSSGAFPLAANILGVGIDPVVGGTIMGSSLIAKGLAEARTMNQLNALSGLITNGGPVARNALSQGQTNALALIGTRAIAGSD